MHFNGFGPAIPLVLALAFQGWVTYRVFRTPGFSREVLFSQAFCSPRSL